MIMKRKVFSYIVLSIALSVVYQVYISMAKALPVQFSLSNLFWLFSKLGLMSAIVIGVAAFIEKELYFVDSVSISGIVWFILTSFRYAGVEVEGCGTGFILEHMIPFFPYLLGAAIGHGIGGMRWPRKPYRESENVGF